MLDLSPFSAEKYVRRCEKICREKFWGEVLRSFSKVSYLKGRCQALCMVTTNELAAFWKSPTPLKGGVNSSRHEFGVTGFRLATWYQAFADGKWGTPTCNRANHESFQCCMDIHGSSKSTFISDQVYPVLYISSSAAESLHVIDQIQRKKANTSS